MLKHVACTVRAVCNDVVELRAKGLPLSNSYEVASHDGSAVCCVGMWNLGHGAADGRLQKLPLMMEVQFVVLECGILVIGRLRSFLFDVCVKCAVGVSASSALFSQAWVDSFHVSCCQMTNKRKPWRDCH